MIHISGYALFPNIKNNHRRLSTLLINYIIFLTYLYIWNITIFPVPAIAFRFFTASAIVPWICPKSIRQSAAGKSQENRTEVFWSRIVGLFNSWLPAAGLNRFGPWGNPIQVCGQHRMVGFVGGLHNNALQCSAVSLWLMIHILGVDLLWLRFGLCAWHANEFAAFVFVVDSQCYLRNGW